MVALVNALTIYSLKTLSKAFHRPSVEHKLEKYAEMESNYSTSSSTSSLSQNFNTSLHTVRKPLTAKPWNKKPIAPLPPTKPKVYQVDPMNFRNLVQELTGLPQQRLQRMAPPSLDMTERPPAGRDVCAAKELFPSTKVSAKSIEGGTVSFGMDKCLMLSPSSYNWCANFSLLSPGTLSSLK